MLASFGFKIVIKAMHLRRSESGKFGKESAISYHTQSFLQFVFSEFLLIAVWTWFKAPDDVFTVYNNLPIKKFSIFQTILPGEGSGTDEISRKNKKSTIYNRLSDGNGGPDTNQDNDGARRARMSESMLSEDGVN